MDKKNLAPNDAPAGDVLQERHYPLVTALCMIVGISTYLGPTRVMDAGDGSLALVFVRLLGPGASVLPNGDVCEVAVSFNMLLQAVVVALFAAILAAMSAWRRTRGE